MVKDFCNPLREGYATSSVNHELDAKEEEKERYLE
jgi:hypothetical protein